MKNTANQVKFTISLAIVFTAIVFNASQATGQFYEEFSFETYAPAVYSQDQVFQPVHEQVVYEPAAPSYDPHDFVVYESNEVAAIAAPAELSAPVEVIQSSATTPIVEPIQSYNAIPENTTIAQPQAMPVQMEVPVQMPMQVPFGGHMPMTCSGGT